MLHLKVCVLGNCFSHNRLDRDCSFFWCLQIVWVFRLVLVVAKIEIADFEKGETVMMSNLCIGANSIIKSSIRLLGIGKFILYTGFSSLAVSLTCWLSPMSSLWRANLSWYRTSSCSLACISSGFKKKSAQLILSKYIQSDWWSRCGFSYSSSCTLYWSSRMSRYFGVCCFLFPGLFLGGDHMFCGGEYLFCISSTSLMYLVVWLLLTCFRALKAASPPIGFSCSVCCADSTW